MMDEQPFGGIHQDDVYMPDVDHEEYEAWINVVANQQHEENQGQGQWLQNTWIEQGDAYREYDGGSQEYDFG